MIRTEELLAARRIDGGRQYFTRAFDFGFSKTLDETLTHWPKDSLLKDVVAIVRAFRPQVIIAVFTGTPADGHGHHQYSGVIAREVFDAAADTVRFPPVGRRWIEAVGAGEVLSACAACATGRSGSTSANIRRCSAHSYSEIATVSRSQHSSQGQGALPQTRTEIQRRDARGVARIVATVPRRRCSTTSTRRGRGSAVSRCPTARRSALDSLRRRGS